MIVWRSNIIEKSLLIVSSRYSVKSPGKGYNTTSSKAIFTHTKGRPLRAAAATGILCFCKKSSTFVQRNTLAGSDALDYYIVGFRVAHSPHI